MWTLNMDHEGAIALMPPYKQVILNKMLTIDKPIGTGDMWDLIQLELGLNSISRASVINFMKKLAKHGYLEYTEESGKGGYHRMYTMTLTKEALIMKITLSMGVAIGEAIQEIFNLTPENLVEIMS